MTPQPDHFEPVFYDHATMRATVQVDFRGPLAKDRAVQWRDQQMQIADEINSWVDEELKDYSND